LYRVMVIDDDEALGTKIVATLSKAGFRAHFYGRTFGVLTAIREAACDLILLDVNMPRLDGRTIARMVRDALSSSNIRVLLYSGMDPDVLERLALAVGAHGAISKQATDEELIGRINAVLSKKPRFGPTPSAENPSN